MRIARFLVLSFLLLCVAASSVSAVDRVIVNSQDWQDVYSGLLFASLNGVPGNFLTSQKHASILLYSISTDEEEQFVVSSRQRPFFVGYESFLRSKGYDAAEELVTRNANLDLAALLTDVTDFIVIDPAYGYNALSAAPYAVVSRSYVLFVDRRNVDDVIDLLEERTVGKVILFGQLDREVKEAFAPFDPETVNRGDRFSNNLAMVERYTQLGDESQVILTNGEFLEAGMMMGDDPIIFIGKANVPDVIQQYVQGSDINVGILIGNELIGTATFIRRQLGISVFVKFAQGARVPTGSIAKVEDLDRFPMPSYQVLLEITSFVYNRATRSLEVTYRNPTDLALFFKGTITVTGMELPLVMGDNEPLFLDKGAYKTVVYTADNDGNPLVLDGDGLFADVFTIFGEAPNSLDNAIQARLAIEFVEVLDDAEINITGLYYDKGDGKFFVTIENVGEVDAYVQPEMVNLVVNDQEVTVASDEVALVPVGKSVRIPVSIEMVEEDFLDNPTVKVRAYYGEREISLVKVKERTFALEFGGADVGKYVLYVVIVVIVLALLFFLGTKKRCKHCGHKNARGRRTCEKCKGRL